MNINDCSWHQTHSWTGQPFMTMNNGCTHVGYLILADDRLSSALTSLENTLFLHDPTGFEDFRRVIEPVFRQGMVQITHHYSSGGYICVELMCERCYSYVIVEGVNSKWGSMGEHDRRLACLDDGRKLWPRAVSSGNRFAYIHTYTRSNFGSRAKSLRNPRLVSLLFLQWKTLMENNLRTSQCWKNPNWPR